MPHIFFDDVKKLNKSRLEKGWGSAVSSIPNVGSFKDAFKALCDHLALIEKEW